MSSVDPLRGLNHRAESADDAVPLPEAARAGTSPTVEAVSQVRPADLKRVPLRALPQAEHAHR